MRTVQVVLSDEEARKLRQVTGMRNVKQAVDRLLKPVLALKLDKAPRSSLRLNAKTRAGMKAWENGAYRDAPIFKTPEEMFNAMGLRLK